MPNSNMKWFFVVIVAALIGSVTWWKISTRSPVAVPSATAELTGAQMDEATDEARLAAHRNPPISSSPAELSRFNHMRHEQAVAKQAKVVDAGRNKLVARYQNEKIDGGWATAREQSLIAHAVNPQIQEMGADPKNLTAHCRSSTCQLSADFPSRVAADDWFTLYLTNTGTDLFNASYQTTINDDGTTHVVVYGLAKKP